MRLDSLQSRSFFSIPGKEFLDFREKRIATAQKRPIVSGIIVTSLCACYELIAYRGHGPHTRRTDAVKQRTVEYLSGKGQTFLLPGADNHSYATASA